MKDRLSKLMDTMLVSYTKRKVAKRWEELNAMADGSIEEICTEVIINVNFIEQIKPWRTIWFAVKTVGGIWIVRANTTIGQLAADLASSRSTFIKVNAVAFDDSVDNVQKS